MECDTSLRLRMYEIMLRIRKVDERALELEGQHLIPGRMHPYIGHEAIAAGLALAMSKKDYSLGTYRGHGHLVAMGGSLVRLFAEFFGRVGGYSKGKGGPMHVRDDSVGFLGTTAIVAGGVPLAAGVGWALQYRNEDRVVVCTFGDGATNNGAFHEGLNIAGCWKLPVLFVCENNQYAISLPIRDATAAEEITDKAAGYGIPACQVDGNDAEQVHTKAKELLCEVRRGKGPVFLEAKTYRVAGHWSKDPLHWRTEEEKRQVKEWETRDPIRILEVRLLESGVGEADLLKIQASVHAEVEEAIIEALAMPPAPISSIFQDVYV